MRWGGGLEGGVGGVWIGELLCVVLAGEGLADDLNVG